MLGRSLGGAVGIHTSALHDAAGNEYIKGVIIENTSYVGKSGKIDW